MASSDNSRLSLLLSKLEKWAEFSGADREAVLSLPYKIRSYSPAQYIARDGDRTEYCSLLLSGYAYRSKIVGDGGRQIVAIHIKGDMVDLQNGVLGIADHNVQALTAIEVALMPRGAILDIVQQHPAVARAMWHETLVDGSTQREWTTNVGRRDAQARLAHLLCEFGLRVEAAGLGSRTHYDLPLTQEQLADCLGLTPVHVNRTLKVLDRQNLITRTLRSVRIDDWDRLAGAGDFNSTYLHLDSNSRALDPATPMRLSA
ncbi:Crp/Fnr family transcriptional regulator [Sphingomonas radiodurans]|uniref:Crp/Fnr family transcriptional regulator n=1 Tax=Sphingomonas radiodurans TaxID=2890321 RepID=UPI001E5738FF|nr:Crp/Fnr family transcriptional regulator [Sphingomonas radiodurans]WBH17649.1 Crp/Fnr family transcriptional regulator [Sphingomonas radiodurans]